MKPYNMEFNLELLKSRGVITVENCVTGDDLDKLNREFEMFCSEENSSYNKHLSYSAGTGRKLILSEIPDSYFTSKFFKSVAFSEAAEKYLGEPFELNKEIFVVEDVPASEHVAQQLHYDIARTLKFFLYLEDTTTENGAFYCVPGSHKWTVRRREEYSDQIIPGNRSFTRQLTKEYGGAKPVEGKAGTLIIFDTDVFHQAGKVRTGRRRVMRGHTRTIREMEDQKIRYQNAKQKSFVQRMLDKFR
jgi:ectoine hydroxylase-related dioxygenase (phytanoyl-CoA dioxygenase family)